MKWLREVVGDVLGADRALLVLRLTCLFLLFRGFTDGGAGFYQTLIAVVCMLMLISERALRTGVLWLGMAAVLADQVVGQVATADNHKYLITYWVLACGLCAARGNREALLHWNGRVLIGVAFALATVWKIVTTEYWDGGFFHYKLLVDPRFQPLAAGIGGLSQAALETNVFLASAMRMMPGADVTAQFMTNDRVRGLALVLSYWTLLIELAIAVWFLVGRRMPWARARHWMLIAFCLSAYVVAPVDRFATLLSLLGLAQCGEGERTERIAFVALFLGSFLIPAVGGWMQG